MENPVSEPPLHRAARLGDVQEVARLVSEGADIEERASGQNLTPLMVAASSTEAATVQVVEWLLTHGADPRATSEIEATAAWYAAGGKAYYQAHYYEPFLPDQVDRLRLLLDLGLDPNEIASNGRSLLFRACRAGDPARVRLLLDRGASVNSGIYTNAEWGWKIPLFAAAESGSVKCVQLLLDAGADVHERTGAQKFKTPSDREMTIEGGDSVLGATASPEIVRLLIAAGAQIDPHDDVLGRVLETANKKAMQGVPNAFAVADVLLEAGAPLDKGRQPGWTRLYSTAFSQQAATVEYLLQCGASRESDDRGSTPLHAICWQRDTTEPADERIIRTLVKAGFSVADRDNEGRTPLHKATGGDGPHRTAVRVLLELGADPNSIDRYGQTPLHLAAIRGELECVQTLLTNGANPQIKDNEGLIPIDYAKEEVQRWTGHTDSDESVDIDQRFRTAIQEYYLPQAQEIVKALQEAVSNP